MTVSGMPATVYYVDPGQVSFQVPAGVSGTVSVQVSSLGVAHNIVTVMAETGAPGIFPVAGDGANPGRVAGGGPSGP